MSRRKWILPGCGLLLALVVIILMVATPAALALRLTGFRSEGKTAELFDSTSAAHQPTITWADGAGAATPPPDGSGTESVETYGLDTPPQIEDGPLDSVMVDIYFLSYPQWFSADEIFAQRMERGTQDGRTSYYLEFDEAGANQYLNYWFGQYVDYQYMDRVKNPWIDLKPGGAIFYADVNLELGWKRVGAVFTLAASGRQFALAGVDLDGKLYSTPPDGQIAQLVQQLESEANRALADLTFLDPAGELEIQVISLDEDWVKVLAH